MKAFKHVAGKPPAPGAAYFAWPSSPDRPFDPNRLIRTSEQARVKAGAGNVLHLRQSRRTACGKPNDQLPPASMMDHKRLQKAPQQKCTPASRLRQSRTRATNASRLRRSCDSMKAERFRRNWKSFLPSEQQQYLVAVRMLEPQGFYSLSEHSLCARVRRLSLTQSPHMVQAVNQKNS